MGKRLGLMFFAAFVATVFITGCRNDPSPPALVITVSIDPANVDGAPIDVYRGGEQSFTATVMASRGEPGGVTWEIDRVPNDQRLYVDPESPSVAVLRPGDDDPDEYLWVYARSNRNPLVYASVRVRLISGDVAVTGVTVTPVDAHVARGTIRQFYAEVTVTGGASQAVTWSIDGEESDGTGISPTGLLTVGADESAETITVTATSDIDETQFDTVTVTITAVLDITAVWLVGLEHPWELPGRPMVAQGNGIFTLRINVGDDRHFRFSPYLATGWGGPWLAPAQNNTSVVLSPGYNPMIYTNAGNSWILAYSGWHDFIVNMADPNNMTLTVERLIEVYSVTVDGPPNVVAGTSANFTATVTGRNPDGSFAPYPDQRVNWSMVGTVGTDFVAGTQIDASTGVLTVSLLETAASLTVMAVFTADPTKSGTATINVEPALDGVNVQIITRPERARRGEALPLEAEILAVSNGAQLDTTLSWSVTGNQSTSTVIRNISQDTLSAELFVALGESAETLTITVTSITDSDTLTVSLGTAVLRIIGGMTGWTPPGLPMAAHPRDAGVFTWAGNVPTNSVFRFGLHDTPNWSGIWFSPRSARTPPVVTYTDITMDTPFYMERIIGESHWNWRIADAGWYEFTVDTIAETLAVHRPVEVDSVTIYSPPAEIMAGGTRAFSATLSGLNYNDPTVGVVWSVTGNSATGTGFGTGGSSHVLTVALGETGPLVVTVTVNIAGTFAVSDSTDPIQVLTAGAVGQMVINFRVDDQGIHRDDVGVTGEPVISIAGNDSVTFAVTNPNPSPTRSYEWIVSGVRNLGHSLTINSANAEDYGIGRHTVRLIVRIDGVPWSMSDLLHFTVTR